MSLTDPAVVNELPESAAELHGAGARLLIEISGHPVSTPAQFSSDLKELKRLKQENVQIDLDDYNLNSPDQWELDLLLRDALRLNLVRQEIKRHPDESLLEALHTKIVERFFEMALHYIELLAAKAEANWQYEVVRGLRSKLFF